MPGRFSKTGREGNAPSLRQLRVGEEIKRILADFTRAHGFHAPELADKLLTFTEARVSPDLRHAWVFTAGVDDAATLKALEKAAPFLRRFLAKKVTLRSVPELRFVADASLNEGDRIDALLRSDVVRRDLSSASEESDLSADDRTA